MYKLDSSSVKCLRWSSLCSPDIATTTNNNDIVVDCTSQHSPQTSSQPFTVRDREIKCVYRFLCV